VTAMNAPCSRNLTMILSAALALQAAGGLFIPGLYRDNIWTVSTYRGMDWVTLVLVVPALMYFMTLARRGSARARMIWLGALYYACYNNLYYLVGAAYNRFFLVYVAVGVSGVFALVATLAETDVAAMGTVRVNGATRRAVAGISLVCAAILTLLWTGQSLVYLATGRLPQLLIDTGGITDLVGAFDLSLIVPPLILGSVWLLRSLPWGLVICAAMMVQCFIITVCLVAVAPFNAAAGIQNAWVMVPLWTAMGAAFLAGAALLLRALPAAGSVLHLSPQDRPADRPSLPSVVAAITILTGALVTMAPSARAQSSSAGGETDSFAIRNVRVFDGQEVLESATVVVRDGRIDSVGTELRVPEGLRAIDGTGKTLLPGLINCHVHSVSVAQLREEMLFGVTTALNMYADPAAVAKARQTQAAAQAPDTADLLSSGNMVVAPGSGATRETGAPAIAGPAEAEAFVEARLGEGSDYIKIIYGNTGNGDPVISEATLRAVVEAAHRRAKLVLVHIDNPDGARAAVDADADGLAHLYLSGQPADLSLIPAARKRGSFVIPTLAVLEALAGIQGAAGLLADPAISPFLSEKAIANLSAPARPNSSLKLSYTEELVGQLSRAGVPILAGTDEPMPGTWHGVSLHRELELLRQSGLTSVQALAAATSVPAERFRLTDRGRIAPGMRADLLLVDGDPTTDILATRKISRVWKLGREMDREAFRGEIQASRNRPSIVVDPAILGTYAGRYDFGQQMVFEFSIVDNRLCIELPNGKRIPLDAASPMEFYTKAVGLDLRVEKDEKGRVTALVIKQGEEQRRGRRVE
jgi:imidazolonepropionase-like amidohydrolase